jgi:hypothetical protein
MSITDKPTPIRPFYLVIRTGHEGIQDLCYLTDDPDEAVRKKASYARGEMLRRIRIAKEIAKEHKEFPYEKGRHKYEDYKDMMCIQEWDGKKFECACSKLDDPPSEMMLR